VKNWLGMALDVTALSDGAQLVRNGSFDVEGEFRRRVALEAALADSSEYGMIMYGPPSGGQYVIIVDDAGNVDSAEAE
jgi:hypothetical protein